jgi:hypothetical protein
MPRGSIYRRPAKVPRLLGLFFYDLLQFSTKEKGFCIIKTKTSGRDLHAKVYVGTGMTKLGKRDRPLPEITAEASRRFGRQMTLEEEGEPYYTPSASPDNLLGKMKQWVDQAWGPSQRKEEGF